jgi:hypothetical protein
MSRFGTHLTLPTPQRTSPVSRTADMRCRAPSIGVTPGDHRCARPVAPGTAGLRPPPAAAGDNSRVCEHGGGAPLSAPPNSAGARADSGMPRRRSAPANGLDDAEGSPQRGSKADPLRCNSSSRWHRCGWRGRYCHQERLPKHPRPPSETTLPPGRTVAAASPRRRGEQVIPRGHERPWWRARAH